MYTLSPCSCFGRWACVVFNRFPCLQLGLAWGSVGRPSEGKERSRYLFPRLYGYAVASGWRHPSVQGHSSSQDGFSPAFSLLLGSSNHSFGTTFGPGIDSNNPTVMSTGHYTLPCGSPKPNCTFVNNALVDLSNHHVQVSNLFPAETH